MEVRENGPEAGRQTEETALTVRVRRLGSGQWRWGRKQGAGVGWAVTLNCQHLAIDWTGRAEKDKKK